MIEYKTILGSLSILIALIGYSIYFKQIFSGKVKPHAFSWFIWGLITGIVFAVQLTRNGGAGAWVTGLTALACFTIFVLALKKGTRDFLIFDWISLASALFAILLWWFTKEPILSIIIITIADAIGALPTIRKSFHKPHEESIPLFALNSIKFFVALFALEAFTLTTYLYPLSLVLTNGLIVLVILIRGRQLKGLALHQ